MTTESEKVADELDKEKKQREEAEEGWTLVAGDEVLGTFDAVLAATGILHHPRDVSFPGLETFAGPAFHTARWPDNVTLDGQRVGIIGTGSTAIQIVTDVVERVRSLKLFQRTAQWIWPEANSYYSDDDKARFKEPGTLQHIRQRMSSVIDERFSNALVDVYGDAMQALERECRDNLERSIKDPELRRKLTAK